MNFIVHKSMWLLMRMRFKGWLRAQFSGKSVGRLIAAIIGTVMFGLWMLNAVLWPVLSGRRSTHGLQTTPEDVVNFGALAMGVITCIGIVFGGGSKLMSFRPAELDLVVPGPYSPRTLINYKLLTIFASGLFSGIFYALIFARHTGHFVSAFIAGVLATLFATLASISLGLLAELAGPKRLAVLIAARTVILAGVAWVIYRLTIAARAAQVAAEEARAAAGTDAAKRLEAMSDALSVRERVAAVLAEPAVSILVAPFKAFSHLFAAQTLTQMVLWTTVCTLMVLLTWAAIVRMHRAWQEVAVRVSERNAKAAEQLVKGRTQRSSLSRRLASLAPQLHWMGAPRAVARRHLTASMPMVLSAPFVGAMVPLAMGYLLRNARPAANGDEPAQLIAGMAGLVLLPAIVFITPALLRMDFRNDLDHIETLKTLPFSATRLVGAQLFTPLLVCTIMAWSLSAACLAVGGGAILSKVDLGVVVLCLAAIPILILLILAIDNTLFLLLPERPMHGKGFNVAMTGKRVLTTAARILTFAVTSLPVVLIGWLTYLISDSMLAAGIAGLIVAGCVAIGGVLLTAWAFKRFDVSRDMPE